MTPYFHKLTIFFIGAFAMTLIIALYVLLYNFAYSWTNPSGNPTTGGGNIIFTNDKTGIGTSTPAFSVDVVGDIRATQKIKQNGIDVISAGMVAFFNLSSCPTGWSELTSARGRYIVGLPSGGTLAGTAGTAFTTNAENRTVGPHSHTNTINNSSHTHTISYPLSCTGSVGCWGYGETADSGTLNRPLFNFRAADSFTPTSPGFSVSSDNANATLTNSSAGTNISATSGTNAPYIQLLACQKS